jgi:hypothetical protein
MKSYFIEIAKHINVNACYFEKRNLTPMERERRLSRLVEILKVVFLAGILEVPTYLTRVKFANTRLLNPLSI